MKNIQKFALATMLGAFTIGFAAAPSLSSSGGELDLKEFHAAHQVVLTSAAPAADLSQKKAQLEALKAKVLADQEAFKADLAKAITDEVILKANPTIAAMNDVLKEEKRLKKEAIDKKKSEMIDVDLALPKNKEAYDKIKADQEPAIKTLEDQVIAFSEHAYNHAVNTQKLYDKHIQLQTELDNAKKIPAMNPGDKQKIDYFNAQQDNITAAAKDPALAGYQRILDSLIDGVSVGANETVAALKALIAKAREGYVLAPAPASASSSTSSLVAATGGKGNPTPPTPPAPVKKKDLA